MGFWGVRNDPWRGPFRGGLDPGGSGQEALAVFSSEFEPVGRVPGRARGEGPPSGTVSGAGVPGSLVRTDLRRMPVFCKVRLELARTILHLLDPAKHLRMCL